MNSCMQILSYQCEERHINNYKVATLSYYLTSFILFSFHRVQLYKSFFAIRTCAYLFRSYLKQKLYEVVLLGRMLILRIKGSKRNKKCNPIERSLILSDAIRLLDQVLTNKARQKRENQKYKANTSRIHEFLRKSLSVFTGSSVIKDPKNYVEKFQKQFEVMMLQILNVWNKLHTN